MFPIESLAHDSGRTLVFQIPTVKEYGIVVWGHSAKANTTRIFVLQKRAERYTAGLKHLESCRNSFRNLKILTVYSLYILETILYVKKSVTAQ
jgi:hypothetical protein